MHLLDTDTLTHLHAGHPHVVERLQKLADPDVGITIVTRIELLRDRFDYILKAATGAELLRALVLSHRAILVTVQWTRHQAQREVAHAHGSSRLAHRLRPEPVSD